MRATLELPGSVAVLEAALTGLVAANVVLMQAGMVPTSPLATNVRYRREASGLEEWNIATRVAAIGWGDCEDLNGWEAAGRVFDGSDPGARILLMRTGPHLLHAVCQLSSGEIVDVCPQLGMRVPGTTVSGLRLPGVLQRLKRKRSSRGSSHLIDHRGRGVND